MTLQRQALQQSVLAQEGSEIALKEQSKAMSAQLSVVEKQLEITKQQLEISNLKIKDINKPKFFVELSFIQLGQICDSNLNQKNFEVSFEYVNTRGQADIRDIECIVLRQNHTDFPIADFLEQQLFKVTLDANIIKITSNFSLYNLAFEQTALGNDAQDNDETGKTINTMRRILIDIFNTLSAFYLL